MEISVKELQTILNRIISKRERPGISLPWVLASSELHNLGFCSHVEPNPSPRCSWAGQAPTAFLSPAHPTSLSDCFHHLAGPCSLCPSAGAQCCSRSGVADKHHSMKEKPTPLKKIHPRAGPSGIEQNEAGFTPPFPPPCAQPRAATPDLPFAPASDLLPRCSLSPEPSPLALLWGPWQTPALPWPPWPHVRTASVHFCLALTPFHLWLFRGRDTADGTPA